MTHLVAVVFSADALDYPRIARDVHRQERAIVTRRLILRGIANEARLEIADEALADPNWTARGDLVGESGQPINLSNHGAQPMNLSKDVDAAEAGITPFLNAAGAPIFRVGTLPPKFGNDAFNGKFASLPWLSGAGAAPIERGVTYGR